MKIEEELTEGNIRTVVEEIVFHPKGHGKGSLYMSKSNFDLLVSKLRPLFVNNDFNPLDEFKYPGTDVKIKVAE